MKQRTAKRVALYRHYNEYGTLLYVGVSLSAIVRLSQHRARSRWFTEIARVDIEWLPSWRAALKAEASAIINEHPIYNVMTAVPKVKIPEDAIAQCASGRASVRKTAQRLGVCHQTLRNRIKTYRKTHDPVATRNLWVRDSEKVARLVQPLGIALKFCKQSRASL